MALPSSKHNNIGRDKLHAAAQVASADPIEAGAVEDATSVVEDEGLPDTATGQETGKVRKIANPPKVAKRPTRTPEEKRAEMERLSREADPFATSEEEEPKAGGPLGINLKKPLVRKLPVAKPDEQPATGKKKLTLKLKAGNTINDMGTEPRETKVAVMPEAHTVGSEAVIGNTTTAADDEPSPPTTDEPNPPDSEAAEPTTGEVSSNDDAGEDGVEEDDRLTTFSGGQKEQIRASFELFHQAGCSVELRILGAKAGGNKLATVSGYFDDLDPFVRAVIEADKLGGNCYVTINPAKQALLARSNNKVTVAPKATTADHDIVTRKFLLVDLDSERPAGVAASEVEVKLTRSVGRWLRRSLSKLGWATPVVVDSGNGLHLLYRIDLPNDDVSKALVRKALAAMAAMVNKKFGDDCPVHVDQSVFNAARISRLPGTTNRKGEGTNERPHRRAKLLHVPNFQEVVSKEKLEALAGEVSFAKGGAAPHTDSPGTSGATTIRNWLAGPGADLEVIREKLTSESTIFELAACPFDENHTGGSAFVGEMANGALFFKCHHNGCAGKDWHALRDLKEPNWRNRKEQKGGLARAIGSTTPEYDDKNAPWTPPETFDEVVGSTRFPVGALPGDIARWVREISVALQMDEGVMGSLALSALATGCQRRIVVEVWGGYQEPTNLYVMVGLLPGSRKSAAISHAYGPIHAAEARKNKNIATSTAPAAKQIERLAKSLRHIESRLAKVTDDNSRAELMAEADKVEADIEKIRAGMMGTLQATIDDATPERAMAVIAEQGGRLTMVSPEGDGLETIAGCRYGNSAYLSFLLKCHAGDRIRLDRQASGTTDIERPALTIAIGVQPDHLRNFATRQSFAGRGLFARFLFVVPPSNIGHREIQPPPLSRAAAEGYANSIERLMSAPMGDDPTVLTLSGEAMVLMREFAARTETELQPGGRLGSIPDWGSKLVGVVARIAGILHMAKHETGDFEPKFPTVIAPETVEAAISLGDYYTAHAEGAYSLMGSDKVTEDAKFLLAAIRRFGAGELPRNTLYHTTKGRFHSKVALFDAAIDRLRAQGFVRKFPGTKDPNKAAQGRKPGAIFAINPFFLDPESEDGGK